MALWYWHIHTLVLITFCVLSLICSFLTIKLMIRLEVHENKLMQFIFILGIAQIIYDIALIPFCGLSDIEDDGSTVCHGIQIMFGSGAGLATAACTNIVSFVVAYVIVTRRTIDVSRRIALAAIIAPAIILASMCAWSYMLSGVGSSDDAQSIAKEQAFEHWYLIYNYVRMAQIAFNALCVIAITYCLWRIDGMNALMGAHHEDEKLNSYSYPMFKLAVRLMWYPVAQAVNRFGASWYELEYREPAADYIESAPMNINWRTQTVALYFHAVLTPAAGIFYFIIFLILKRGAWADLQKLLCCEDPVTATSHENECLIAAKPFMGHDGERSRVSSQSIASQKSHRSVYSFGSNTSNNLSVGGKQIGSSSVPRSRNSSDDTSFSLDRDRISPKATAAESYVSSAISSTSGIAKSSSMAGSMPVPLVIHSVSSQEQSHLGEISISNNNIDQMDDEELVHYIVQSAKRGRGKGGQRFITSSQCTTMETLESPILQTSNTSLSEYQTK